MSMCVVLADVVSNSHALFGCGAFVVRVRAWMMLMSVGGQAIQDSSQGMADRQAHRRHVTKGGQKKQRGAYLGN